MAILISGIGRSGTTTIYQILGKGLLAKYKDARCVYEPDLWNIPEVEHTAKVKGQPFNVGQVGLFNLMVHCNTPLFLSGRNMLHDAWLSKVFGSFQSSSLVAPENVLAKVIRSSGRLEAALTRFENLKVVIVTRNVVDTVNSGLGLFSFFGDEFHPSDKSRFVQEVNELFNAGIKETLKKNELQWSVLWWHYFTEASIRTYEKYPEKVLLVPYEKYMENQQEVMGEIFDFTGIDRTLMDQALFDEGAGPRTSVSHLDVQGIEQMNDEISWYFKRLSEAVSFNIDPLDFRRKLVAKYSKRKFVKSLLLTEKTDLTAVQWRMKLKNELTKQESLVPEIRNQNAGDKIGKFSVARAVAEFGSNDAALLNIRSTKRNSVVHAKASRSLGVLVTCFNNENTIAEAIYSVLSQSIKPDLVVVADDCSTDGSVAIIREIAAKHKVVQLVARAENVGVAANRDLAIRGMSTDYITTLDGDDLFLPSKLELEYLALGGETDMVAFSNIAVLTPKENFVQDTSAYSVKNRQQILNMLTSRSAPVPRDMMFPRGLFEKANGFDVGMDIYEDWAFKIRLMSVSKNAGWVHTGGIGTVYDRRLPGLSGKPPIFHAHGQLLVIARNSNVLREYPDALYGGLKTVAKQLEGETRKVFDQFIESSSNKKDIGLLVDRLSDFWRQASFNNDVDRKRLDIMNLSVVK